MSLLSCPLDNKIKIPIHMIYPNTWRIIISFLTSNLHTHHPTCDLLVYTPEKEGHFNIQHGFTQQGWTEDEHGEILNIITSHLERSDPKHPEENTQQNSCRHFQLLTLDTQFFRFILNGVEFFLPKSLKFTKVPA